MRVLVGILGALAGYLLATNLVESSVPAVDLGLVLAAMVAGAVVALSVRRGLAS